MGAHAARLAPLRTDIPLISPEPASAEEWVAAARRDNFDVRAAQLRMQAAERDVAAQRGRGLPTISLTGASSKLNQDEVLGGNQTLDTIGVSFSWPLFQGGAVASAVRQSRALYREATAVYDSTQRDAEKQCRAAYRGIVSGIARIGAAHRAVESGRGAVEASRDVYKRQVPRKAARLARRVSGRRVAGRDLLRGLHGDHGGIYSAGPPAHGLHL